MNCPKTLKPCQSTGCYFDNGYNRVCSLLPMFKNGGQIPAYGNEKTAAQVIAELREQLAEARMEADNYNRHGIDTYEELLKSNKESAALKEVIKELIPIAEAYTNQINQTRGFEGWRFFYENAKAIIDKARPLLNKQPQSESDKTE